MTARFVGTLAVPVMLVDGLVVFGFNGAALIGSQSPDDAERVRAACEQLRGAMEGMYGNTPYRVTTETDTTDNRPTIRDDTSYATHDSTGNTTG